MIAIGIWVGIFLVWYVRTYPEKFGKYFKLPKLRFHWPRRPRTSLRPVKKSSSGKGNYKDLVRVVESISSQDSFQASDAAAMVEAVKSLMEIEPASGQIWEAFALDSLETADIECDDCRVPVTKTVKKTGVKIECPRCRKWLALKNSKVTVLDPHRIDIEEWER